ncbi:MAG TPA: PAS domain S-box protein, partial [Pirellulales bacterium]|nr:PAS domain S-box protein [Pirellulales bacterium]
QFAVVLLDVRLPGIDGFETARRIRSLESVRHTPLIFITAFDIERSQIEYAYSLGAVDFIVKPITPAVLRAKVAGLLRIYQEKERAKREADLLRLLVQATTDYAIFMLDPGGNVASWNTGAERLKGYKAHEIIGQHFSRFYPREAVERGWPAHELRVARAEGRFEDEGWRVRKDGTHFWANVVITALRDEAGTFCGFSKITRDLTQRRRLEDNARRLAAEAAARRVAEENARLIQDERERLHVTLSSIGDAVITTDAQSKITFLNPIAESLTGWKADEAAGRDLDDVFQILHEGTHEPVENPTERAIRDGTIVGLANHTVLISKDGAERSIDDSAAPIRSAEGEIVGSVLVFRDVTRQRRSEQHRNARLAMTQILNQAATVQEAVARILRTMCDSLGWDVGFFWSVNEEQTALVCRQSWHRMGMKQTEFESETCRRKFVKGEGLPGQVWEIGKPAWILEVLQESNFPRKASAVEHDLHSAIGCPVVAGEETLGVIEFFTRAIREADADLLELMGTIAGSLGLFMQRKSAETALLQREAALRRSEERFRQLANSMPQIVWAARPDGNIDFLNRRWTEFTGLPDTAGNEGWKTIVHPDDVGPATERWEASVKTGSPFERELRLYDRHRHGYRWHLIRTVAVRDDAGSVARWFGTSTDIQQQKRAEESSRFLAAASAALAGVVDYESTLQKIANMAVPHFADWAAVDVADGNGLRRLAVAHQDHARIESAHELARLYPPDVEASGGIAAVFRTGKPEIVAEITDEMLAAGAKDERHLQLIRSLGLKSVICVPLTVSGESLGVLTFATAESDRSYTDADLELAMDLANRAAIAIENTRLYEALRDADRRKDEFLATLAHELRNPLAPIRNSLQILRSPPSITRRWPDHWK